MSFKYDPFGRRIQKSSGSGTIDYVYDGANVTEEVDSGGNVLAKYAASGKIEQQLEMARGGTTSYYEPDGIFSITSVSNSAGALTDTYNYASFGNVVGTTGTTVNPFRYAGRDLDFETGLYYYRARYYEPQNGRFLSEDPIGFASGDVNFYEYVFNNPVIFIDPTGYRCTCTFTITYGQFWCYGPGDVGPRIDTYAYSGYPPFVNDVTATEIPGIPKNPATGGPIPLGTWNMDRATMDIRAGRNLI